MNKIIVNNKRRVSKYLGFNVNDEDDLLEIKECKQFIIENKKYFESINKEHYQEFFEQTGLNITHIYLSENYIEPIRFNKMGCSINNPHEVYNHDLLILTKVDEIIIHNNIILADGKKIYDLYTDDNTSFKKECSIRNKLSMKNTIEEQIEIIKEYYPQYNLNPTEVKQIYLSMFGDLFILNNNGNLYCNNKKYEENVEYIYQVDSYDVYLIFKDNNLEYLLSKYSQFESKKLDKILYSNTFLALLKNNILKLTIIDELPDTSICQIYQGIDDITLEISEDCYIDNELLTLHIGKEKIVIDNCSIWVETI